MKLAQRFSYVGPLLRHLGRAVQDEDIPFEEYRISIILRSNAFYNLNPRAALKDVSFDNLNAFLSVNVILWVAPYCFIMSSGFDKSFHYLLLERDLYRNCSPKKFTFLYS
jgi:hypothetical protein